MTKEFKYFSAFFITGFLLFNIGCGNDDDGNGGSETKWISYSGKETQATIDASNAKFLTAEAKSNLDNAANMEDDIKILQKALVDVISGSVTNCGGEFSKQDSPPSLTIVFSDYCLSSDNDQIVLQGEVNLVQVDTQTIIRMLDFDFTLNGKTTTLNATLTTNTQPDLSWKFEYLDADGLIYRVDNIFAQTVPEGTLISGRFYHPKYGYVEIITTTAIVTENCSGTTLPTQGVLEATGENGTATAEYLSCNDYEICFAGFCETLLW